ncbi:bifunctional thymidylate/uridylate kinase NDAI_0D01420 [Naumovozyma dairenensis CBS 421]|uniref:Thymidylate kinase n=1 Tax=Naumovozyma dairenensis (strain ATCC 10597 / BCRC 20456 / CBS 421 / NBRC 0211 / NRRL Y-12639) TaxID=1071378 RepID=G0W9J5_NAUDC|nr:hypothetical protein NDAI_0D01420 [Naumovozyma dairenensis CBS 421]CCD24456.1 hypothetical protein NDAI_0D01420 [Naumovozyma dairenensis CBS 421]
MGRGKLILVEGLDRTGKTTQTTLLLKKLSSQDAKLIKFPDRTTPIGKLIDNYLTDKEFHLPDQAVHLLFSANRWEVADSIKQLLLEGKIVILDRYVYSGIAYSAAKNIPGMDLKWCLQPDKGLLKPDLTIFLTNDNDNDDKKGFGEERYENVQFQKEVKNQFIKVFSELDSIDKESETLKIVNVTNKSIIQVEEEIWSFVQPVVLNENCHSDTFSYF